MRQLTFRSKPPPRSQLRKLSFDSDQNKQTTAASALIYLLFVPDLCVKEPEKTLKSSWKQLRSSICCPSNGKAHALGFEYHLGSLSEEESVWESVRAQAKTLVEVLKSEIIVSPIVESSSISSSLVVFSYGLGGILVKEALSIIYHGDQSPACQNLRELHQGTVLFGTPHPTFANRDLWENLRLTLRHTVKELSRLQYIKAELKNAQVATVSENFQERLRDVSVITAYETLPTRLQKGLTWRKTILVDAQFAEISVRHENLIRLNADHFGLLGCANNDIMLDAIKRMITKALRWASRKNSTTSSAQTPPSGNDCASIRQESIHDVLSEGSDEAEDIIDPTDADQFSHEPPPGTRGDLYLQVGRAREEINVLSDLESCPLSLQAPYTTLKPSDRNDQFTGRQKLLGCMETVLVPRKESKGELIGEPRRELAICGMGGVGKTELAREFAFSRQHYFDAVIWVEAEEATQLSEGFELFATYLGANTGQDRVVSRNIAREWFNNPTKRPKARPKDATAPTEGEDGAEDASNKKASWLLIFNNADDLSLLEDYWPDNPDGSILLTSRNLEAQVGRLTLDLEPFDRKEAADLLRQLTPGIDHTLPQNVQASLDIAERLGGLPLAITQIAAFITKRDKSLPEFVAFYDRYSVEKLANDRALRSRGAQYKHSIFTVWALEGLSSNSWSVLQVLSFLNPDSIKESLIRPPFPPTQVLPEEYPMDEFDFDEARSDLSQISLIRRNRDYGRLTVHRLVQDIVRSQMKRPRMLQMLEFAAFLVLKGWPTAFLQFDHDTATWEASEDLLPHIIKLKGFFDRYSAEIESPEAHHNLARLLLFAGWYLRERNDFEQAKPLLLHVLRLSDASLASSSQSESNRVMTEIRADALFSLSVVEAEVNESIQQNLKYAWEHYELRVKLRDGTVLGEARIAMAHGELAHIQMLAGQYDDAIHNAQIGIDMTEVTKAYKNGSDFPTFASSHQAFALAARGDYDKAMHRLQLALDYWTTHSSEGHLFQLGIVHRCLAFVKRKQGLLDEAFGNCFEALQNFRKTVGSKSHYVAHMCSILGSYHMEKIQYETASLYLEAAVKGYRAHSCYRAQLALALFRQAKLQKAMGDTEAAELSLRESMDLYKVVSGIEDVIGLTEEQLLSVVPLIWR